MTALRRHPELRRRRSFSRCRSIRMTFALLPHRSVDRDGREGEWGVGGGVGDSEGVVHQQRDLLERVFHFISRVARAGGGGGVGNVELTQDALGGIDLYSELLVQR